MSSALRICVAEDQARMRAFMAESLARLGHDVVAAVGNGRELVRQCRSLQPDLVIADIRMPDLDGLEAAAQICREDALPFILVSAFQDADLIERARKNRLIFAYMVKPIKDTDLGPAIAVVMQRFDEFQAVRKEADDCWQALEDRKVIEQAKGILMNRSGLSEAEAFRHLQKIASSKSQKLIEIARSIVTAEDVFQQKPGD